MGTEAHISCSDTPVLCMGPGDEMVVPGLLMDIVSTLELSRMGSWSNSQSSVPLPGLLYSTCSMMGAGLGKDPLPVPMLLQHGTVQGGEGRLPSLPSSLGEN